MPEIDEKEIERRFKAISQFELEPEITIRDLKRTRESLTGQISKQQARTKKIWRTIMKSPLTKLATAAVIVIGTMIVIHYFTGSFDGSSIALGQVIEDVNGIIENMKRMPWVVKTYREPQGVTLEEWFCFEREYWIAKTPAGAVVSYNYAEGRKYDYNPDANSITIASLHKGDSSYSSFSSPRAILESLYELVMNKSTKPQTKISRERSRYKGMDVEILKIAFSTNERKYRTDLFIDTKRKVLIRELCNITDSSGKTVLNYEEEFNYPEKGPADIYALGVPRTANVIDKTDVTLAKRTEDPTLVALDITLPKPMFAGTPQDNRVENLEKPLGKPRPPFLAPAGTKNVALGKPVSSSDEEPIIGQLDMITDGDKEAPDGSYVELGPFPQQVTIDLGAIHKIYAVVVWHYHKQPRVYFDVVVQVTDDKYFITNVKTLFNNDIDNSAGLGAGKDLHYIETNEGKLIDAKGVKARYVRLYSNGNINNDLNHYIEVEVYGKPVE
jgi:hypothetical protein